MPQFNYRAVTPAGELVSGQVEAPSHAEVIRRIEYLGHMPIDARPAAQARFGRSLGGKAPRPRDITIFLRQLALLVEAGLTLEAALQTLSDDDNRAVARFAADLRSTISAGHSFAEALERHPSIVEPAYVAMVRAGEASGKVEGALRAIVEDRARKDLLAERINSAIRYPLFLIASAILILLFFLSYVVPQFETVLKTLATGSIRAPLSCSRPRPGCMPTSISFSAAAWCWFSAPGWCCTTAGGARACSPSRPRSQALPGRCGIGGPRD